MEDNKKNRGLGKGLSELLGEARAKAALSKQAHAENMPPEKNNISKKIVETSTDFSIKDKDLNTELDILNNISDDSDTFTDKNHQNIVEVSDEAFDDDIYDDITSNMDSQETGLSFTEERDDTSSYNTGVTLEEVEDTENQEVKEDDDAFETILPETFDEFPQQVQEQEENQEPDQDTVIKALLDLEKNMFKNAPQAQKKGDASLEVLEQETINIQKRTENLEKQKAQTLKKPLNSPVLQNKKDIIHHLPIELVNPNKEQPRKFFDTSDLNDLASSIKMYGVIQPILVQEKDNEYLIVAGERRWRASQIAGLKTIPAIIVDYNEDEILEVALIENIQRANLTPIDEAKAYYYLIHKYELTQNELAQKVGKSRSYIANMVRLLELDDNVKNYLETGELSIGHARVLVGVKNAADLADKIVKSHMSVRKVEELISQLSEKQNVRLPKALNTGKNTDILALEADLRAALGVNVSINAQSAHRGSLVIRYESLDQLDEVCRRLCSTWGADVA